jgi:hypothetical protein
MDGISTTMESKKKIERTTPIKKLKTIKIGGMRSEKKLSGRLNFVVTLVQYPSCLDRLWGGSRETPSEAPDGESFQPWDAQGNSSGLVSYTHPLPVPNEIHIQ